MEIWSGFRVAFPSCAGSQICFPLKSGYFFQSKTVNLYRVFWKDSWVVRPSYLMCRHCDVNRCLVSYIRLRTHKTTNYLKERVCIQIHSRQCTHPLGAHAHVSQAKVDIKMATHHVLQLMNTITHDFQLYSECILLVFETISCGQWTYVLCIV
jgi:hypothetical protein